ncbi:AAA family ATPase [Lactobacillus corticis]|uniref:Adenylate kinase n=1 Tax=Lactobacillus corticis TaxID=2201249 RepID=A0A916QJL2_9LACO|nr:AAA family ATPase [Lactobacillus corticis]GFZ26316.1 adenylate kinase [Lactobacillus corticis]
MIILITGASHTGKTNLAQKLLEKYHYPYLSIDHLKMGLIRSGQTSLTPEDDLALRDYLWPIVREMIKTAIENQQNLIVEGGYVPFTWKDDFSEQYLAQIKYYCLVMSPNYLEQHFTKVKEYANIVEKRVDDSGFTKEIALKENQTYLEQAQKYQLPYILIDSQYKLPSNL